MLSGWLDAIIARSIEHPRRVLVFGVLVLMVSLWLATRVELVTSRTAMAPADDLDQQRLIAVEKSFAGGDPLIVVVEALPGQKVLGPELRRVADEVARAIERLPSVRSVLHRVSREWLESHGLWLAPDAERDAVARRYEDLFLHVEGARPLDGWEAWSERIAARLARWKPGDEQELGLLHRATLAEAHFFEDIEGFFTDLEKVSFESLLGGDPDADHEAYLQTKDGQTLYLLVAPADPDDSLPAQRRFTAEIGQVARTALERWPRLRIGLTGEPALNVEEMDAVEEDTWFTGLIAGLGVAILALFAFRWQRYSLVALVGLGFGVSWAFGAVDLQLGHLNLITSAFVSILIGVGIDFFVHPVSELELEGAHTVDGTRAVRRAFQKTAPAVLVSGLTTAGAFFCVLLMDYEGFAEMGIITGTGVLLCLLAMLTVFAALLSLVVEASACTGAAAAKEPWLMPALGRLVASRGKLLLLIALLVTVALGFGVQNVRFDTDIMELLPKGSPAVSDLKRMANESDLSPRLSYILADDVAALRRLEVAAKKIPEISRFESALGLLVRDESVARRGMEALRARLDRLTLGESPATTDPAALAPLLERVATLAREHNAAVVSATERDLLNEIALKADRAKAAVEKAKFSVMNAWPRALTPLLDGMREAVTSIRRIAAADPPSPSNLPEELRERLMTRDGKLVGFLHPAGDVFEPEFLTRFNRACRSLDETAIGWPVMFEKISNRIASGFQMAFLAGALLVLVVMIATFRSASATVLAMVPLVVGLLWLLGAMGILGLPFNLANLVALPLILGVGIDNGVHVVHRYRSERGAGIAHVVARTGRGIFVASLTTMIGFGSLALASHRGMASLGLALLMGVGSCLVTSTVVLPAVLGLLDRRGGARPGGVESTPTRDEDAVVGRGAAR